MNRLTVQPQPTTRWRLTVGSWGSLYMLTFYLEIHSFFEGDTVDAEWRRKGHCEGNFNPLSLYVREISCIDAVYHAILVYHRKELFESLNKHCSSFFQFFRSISLFWGWSMHAWPFPRIDRPIRTLHWFTFIAYNRQQRILPMRSWQWKARELRYFGTLS